MIHKTAIIDPKANISKSVKVGAYSVIGANVEIGENTEIQNHVSIVGKTIIGIDNKIYPFASIGNDPQDMKYKGEKTKLIIGNENIIREYSTINPGTVQGGGITKIGNKNLIMIGAHIAHDCILGNEIVIANNAAIAGHAQIDDNGRLVLSSRLRKLIDVESEAIFIGMGDKFQIWEPAAYRIDMEEIEREFDAYEESKNPFNLLQHSRAVVD